jgi:hypothetical protein
VSSEGSVPSEKHEGIDAIIATFGHLAGKLNLTLLPTVKVEELAMYLEGFSLFCDAEKVVFSISLIVCLQVV